jgi:hypothetical protein
LVLHGNNFANVATVAMLLAPREKMKKNEKSHCSGLTWLDMA